ncbi:MAG TPA: hypothetical protein VN700_06225 [Vicinamibacterales bacterium]|nr:hypothetical protein [Vicinamibacterales bacterium]
MTASVILLALVCGMAIIAVAAFTNRNRVGDPRRHAASGSDGYVPWMGGDSSGSDCGSGDGGGCGDGGGGGD